MSLYLESINNLPNKGNYGLFRAGYIYVLKCPKTQEVKYVGKRAKVTFCKYIKLLNARKNNIPLSGLYKDLGIGETSIYYYCKKNNLNIVKK